MDAQASKHKLRLLALARMLMEDTDPHHPISVRALGAALLAAGYPTERKALYRDLAALRQSGLDIRYRNGAGGGWFLATRTVEPAELRLLIDAVQAAQFLSPARTAQLVERLVSLASRHQAPLLARHVYVDGRQKTDSELVSQNAQRLYGAMEAGRAVTFRYFTYSPQGDKILRREGMKYTVSPKGLLWSQERYYLAGFDHDRQEMRHFRVDKMQDVTRSGQPQLGPPLADFDPAAYAARHFGMFHGRRAQVTLRCSGGLAGVMLDRFGRDTPLTPHPKGGFTVTAEVAVSPQFYGWLFGLDGQAVLLEPYWAVVAYQERLKRALDARGVAGGTD